MPMPRISARAVVVTLVGLLVVAQVYRPAQTNPVAAPEDSFWAHHPGNEAAKAIFDRSCQDCHSNDTTWPWYSKVAPVSWLISRDVREGRRELNLSEFYKTPTPRPGQTPEQAATMAVGRRSRKVKEICDQVKEGEMPMWIYTAIHQGAKLQPGDADTLCALMNLLPPAPPRPTPPTAR